VPGRSPHNDRHGDEAGGPDVPREVDQASPTAADRAFAGRTERLDDGDPAPESGNRTDFRDAPVAGDDRPHTSAADRGHLRREDGLDSEPGQP
ncbi:MAG: hypothetical protein Q4P32_09090, partial [Micrococcales bacterium]|nr:hypothetical protein [Micrococcales bacterium]